MTTTTIGDREKTENKTHKRKQINLTESKWCENIRIDSINPSDSATDVHSRGYVFFFSRIRCRQPDIDLPASSLFYVASKRIMYSVCWTKAAARRNGTSEKKNGWHTHTHWRAV